jgi:hypothetical protein
MEFFDLCPKIIAMHNGAAPNASDEGLAPFIGEKSTHAKRSDALAVVR